MCVSFSQLINSKHSVFRNIVKHSPPQRPLEDQQLLPFQQPNGRHRPKGPLARIAGLQSQDHSTRDGPWPGRLTEGDIFLQRKTFQTFRLALCFDVVLYLNKTLTSIEAWFWGCVSMFLWFKTLRKRRWVEI